MKITPLGERVLVKHRAAETKTAGGVILPTLDKNKEPVEYGDLVAVSGDLSGAAIGRTVLFHRHAGVVVEIEGVKHQLLLWSSVLGFVEMSEAELLETAAETPINLDTLP